jgi:hypothetical protein
VGIGWSMGSLVVTGDGTNISRETRPFQQRSDHGVAPTQIDF